MSIPTRKNVKRQALIQCLKDNDIELNYRLKILRQKK